MTVTTEHRVREELQKYFNIRLLVAKSSGVGFYLVWTLSLISTQGCLKRWTARSVHIPPDQRTPPFEYAIVLDLWSEVQKDSI